MTEPKDFLARWSRRKRAATVDDGAAQPPVTGNAPARRGDDVEKPVAPAPQAPETESTPEPVFNLASLPSIDSINAASDVAAFLQHGVPAELARAALRRAWSADPAIRDFVGLAENAWDFNDPKTMDGFGPLDQSPEQVQQMVAELFGEGRRAVDDAAGSGDSLVSSSGNDSSDIEPIASEPAATPDKSPAERAETSHFVAATDGLQSDIAAQHDNDQDRVHTHRRVHGGALPHDD